MRFRHRIRMYTEALVEYLSALSLAKRNRANNAREKIDEACFRLTVDIATLVDSTVTADRFRIVFERFTEAFYTVSDVMFDANIFHLDVEPNAPFATAMRKYREAIRNLNGFFTSLFSNQHRFQELGYAFAQTLLTAARTHREKRFGVGTVLQARVISEALVERGVELGRLLNLMRKEGVSTS